MALPREKALESLASSLRTEKGRTGAVFAGLFHGPRRIECLFCIYSLPLTIDNAPTGRCSWPSQEVQALLQSVGRLGKFNLDLMTVTPAQAGAPLIRW